MPEPTRSPPKRSPPSASASATTSSKFDFASVIQLDEVALPRAGPARRASAHPRRLGRAQRRPRGAGRHGQHRRGARRQDLSRATARSARCIAVGAEVKRFKPGDVVVTHCNGEPDIYGYPLRIWAYDQPESIGWYGEEAVVGEWQIIPAPLDVRAQPLGDRGAAAARADRLSPVAPRARHLPPEGRRASSCARSNVLGFGGGVSELFLMLAQHEGHRAFFCSGSPERARTSSGLGIEPIDQKAVQPLRQRATTSRPSTSDVKKLTGGVGMHIVCDMLRGPVFAAGSRRWRALGVNVSAGWQLDTSVHLQLGEPLGAPDHARPHPLRDGRRLRTPRPSSTARCSSRPCTGRSTPSRICRARCTRCTRTRRRASRSCAWRASCRPRSRASSPEPGLARAARGPPSIVAAFAEDLR